jgi:septum formation protein
MVCALSLVLASASPRRQVLLSLIGIPFRVVPSGIEEDLSPASASDVGSFVERAAAEKARAVAEKVGEGLILGADTVVVVEGEPLGKPKDEADAARMLRLLSGRDHQVCTGIALMQVEGGRRISDLRAHEATTVTFRELSEGEIQAYIATGEPMDKAGAYAVQGRGAALVKRIEGCYYNVVGLPLARLVELLFQLGIRPWDWKQAEA